MTCQSAPRRGLDVLPVLGRGSACRLSRHSLLVGRGSACRLSRHSLLVGAALALLSVAPAAAQSLYGSHESLVRQNLVAQQHDYAYLRNTQELMQAVETGVLIPVRGNEDFQLAGDEVSFPYARREVKTFLEQLAHAYRAACGEPLVVTSLVRPISHQPWNASPISVHPTGMAVDLRRSDRHGCRQWLESTLLALEGQGMVEAIREHWPPHYHVAVFPDPLLLPGPIGDPNGVVRVVALAALHGGTLSEPDVRPLRSADDEEGGRHGRVYLSRSARTGRLRIAQAAIAHRSHRPASGRIVVHHRGGADRRAAGTAGAGGNRHPKHRSRSRAAARGTASATAR